MAESGSADQTRTLTESGVTPVQSRSNEEAGSSGPKPNSNAGKSKKRHGKSKRSKADRGNTTTTPAASASEHGELAKGDRAGGDQIDPPNNDPDPGGEGKSCRNGPNERGGEKDKTNEVRKRDGLPRVRATRDHGNPEFLSRLVPDGSELLEWNEDPTPGATWDTGNYVACSLTDLSSEATARSSSTPQDAAPQANADPEKIKKLLTAFCKQQHRGPLWLDPTPDNYEYNEFVNVQVRFGNMIDECTFVEHFSFVANEAVFEHSGERLDLYTTRGAGSEVRVAHRISLRYRQVQRAALEVVNTTSTVVPRLSAKVALTTTGIPLIFEVSKGYSQQIEKAAEDQMSGQILPSDAEMQRAGQFEALTSDGHVRKFEPREFGRCRTIVIEVSEEPDHLKTSSRRSATEVIYPLVMELNRRLKRANAEVYFCRINIGVKAQQAPKDQLWSRLCNCALRHGGFGLLYIMYCLRSSDLLLDQMLMNREDAIMMEELLQGATDNNRLEELTRAVKAALATIEVAQVSLVRCMHAAKLKGKPTQAKGYAIRQVILTPSYDEFRLPEMRSRSSLPHDVLQADFLLEVTLRDDDGRTLGSQLLSHDAPKIFLKTFAEERIRNGIMVGDWRFNLVGWTEQQIRRHSLWAYCEDGDGMEAWQFQSSYLYLNRDRRGGVRVDQRHGRGDPFSTISHSMKRLSNLARKGIRVPEASIETINDQPLGAPQGEISSELLRKLCGQLKGPDEPLPSAIHTSIGTQKVILVLNPTLQGELVRLRQETLSFVKFKRNNLKLILLSYSQARTCHLNRQIIALLEELGVPAEIFLKWQMETAVESIRGLLDSDEAVSILRQRCEFDFPFKMLEKVKATLYEDPFINRLLQDSLRSTLLRLQYKTFLRVDPAHGRQMLGIIDQSGVLKNGEVYVRYSPLDDAKGVPCVVTGSVLVTKNPALEPEDVRVFEAIAPPELELMDFRDVIVFSRHSNGARDGPLLGGYPVEERSFIVTWRNDLTDPINDDNNQPPPNENPPVAAGARTFVHDEADVFCTFIANPAVGILCNHHLAKSDKRWRRTPNVDGNEEDYADEQGSEAEDEEEARACRLLAEKIRLALRFWDTGEIVRVKSEDKAAEFPHFMRKDFRDSYHSPRVLSKLYDSVTPLVRLLDLAAKQCHYGTEAGALFEVPGWQRFRSEAEALKDSFDRQMRSLLRSLGLRSETELFLRTQGELSDDFLEWANTGFFGEAHRERERKSWKQRDEMFSKVRRAFERRLENYPGRELAELQFVSACFMVSRNKSQRNELSSFPWIHAEFLDSYFNDISLDDIGNVVLVASTVSPLLLRYPRLADENGRVFMSIENLLNGYGASYKGLLRCTAEPTCLEDTLPTGANDITGPEGGGWLRAVREYLEECCSSGQLQFRGNCLANNPACGLLSDGQSMRWLAARTLMRMALTADLCCFGLECNRWRHLRGSTKRTISTPLHPALKAMITGENQANLITIGQRLEEHYALTSVNAEVAYHSRASTSLRLRAKGSMEKIEQLEQAVARPTFQYDLARADY